MIYPEPIPGGQPTAAAGTFSLRKLAKLAAGALILVAGGMPAYAADLTVIVKNTASEPVRDAVVTVDRAAGAPMPRPGSFEVVQRDIRFDPFVLIVPVGSVVEFPNRDKVRHHVYSFSPTKRFELKLYSQEEHRSIRFDKTGAVALGCNIHDQMSAFIKVVDTPHVAKADDNGRAVLRGVQASVATLRVWHPYLRAPGNEVVLKADATRAAPVSVTVSLRRPAPMSHDY